ncbi:MAG: MFS transporter [Ktedonobacterales bacterium]
MATPAEALERSAGTSRRRIGGVRWSIAVLLGAGIVINYFDRINLSIATKPLMAQFHLTPAEMGVVLSSFLWSYALLQIPIGTLLDRFGVTWLMRISTILWTIATFLTAIASGLGFLLFARVILGIAEAPAFPAASKATGYWFPLSERGRATSAFDAAAKFSNVIGLPLVAFAVTQWGWRGGFVFTGILSAFYALAFWIWYRDPNHHPKVSKEEYNYVRAGGAQDENVIPVQSGKALSFLLRQRKVWGLTLGFAAYGYSFYLLLTWLPGYLQTQMHLSVLSSGWYTAIPWAVATATDLIIGGWLVDKLIAQGHEPTRVRKTILVIGMVLGLAVIGAAFTNSVVVATFWISIALGGLAFAAPVGWSIPAIIAPDGTTGMVGSVMNFFNNLAGIAAPIVTGIIVGRTGSFALGFIIAGIVLALGILSYVFLLGDITQIARRVPGEAEIPPDHHDEPPLHRPAQGHEPSPA